MGKKSRKKKEAKAQIQAQLLSQSKKNSFSKKTIIIFLLIIVLGANLLLMGKNIFDPFIRFNEDNNALYGSSARNWSEFGFLKLKAGMSVPWLDNVDKPINYYAHHPSFFLLPTMLSYKLFGVNEFTTRLAPAIFALLSIVVFFLLIYEVSKNYVLAFLSSFIFATMPVITFYGKMLDQEIFIIFFALSAFYLFFKIKNSKQQSLIYLLFATIVLGGLMGWHFYFVPIIIWFLIVFDKNYPKRKLFIFLIPLITTFVFFLNIYHINLLQKESGVSGLKKAFTNRTSSVAMGFWLKRMYLLLKLNFTLPIIILGFGWLICLIRRIFKKQKNIKLGVALFLLPALVTLIFRQWVTHPYGPFYWVAFLALAGGEIVWLSYNKLNQKYKGFAIIFLILFLILQFYSGFRALKFFDENLILDKESIAFIKEIKNDFPEKSIIVGHNPSGLGYGAIFSFYLEKELNARESDSLAIIFNPQMGPFFEEEAQKFLDKGYEAVKCQGVLCLLKN